MHQMELQCRGGAASVGIGKKWKPDTMRVGLSLGRDSFSAMLIVVYRLSHGQVLSREGAPSPPCTRTSRHYRLEGILKAEREGWV